MKNDSLQKLVDEHAREGMTDVEIQIHLRKEHDIPVTDLIPPASQSARRQNDIVERLLIPSDNKQIKIDLPEGHPEVERIRREAAKIGMEVKAQEPLSNEEWLSNYFAEFYCSTGQTLLDRLIHGNGQIYHAGKKTVSRMADTLHASLVPIPKKDLKENQSDFEITRDRGLKYAESFNDAGLKLGFTENFHMLKSIDAMIFPWIEPRRETDNIQITAEMAQLLIEAAPSTDDGSWIHEIKQKPFYIDIKESRHGERTLSGIFCRPIDDSNTFMYMAVVEWVSLGYEAFIIGEYGSTRDQVSVFPVNSASGLDSKALDAVYTPIVGDIPKLITSVRLYYKNALHEKQVMPILSSMPTSGGGKDKKARARAKTHSYFRVKRLETPSNRFGRGIDSGRSWSLDHLITVNGHFRWQPHGEGRQFRKLIWIDAFEKGHGQRHGPETNPVLISSTLKKSIRP